MQNSIKKYLVVFIYEKIQFPQFRKHEPLRIRQRHHLRAHFFSKYTLSECLNIKFVFTNYTFVFMNHKFVFI